MNWAWATSLDQLWRSPTFPMWLTLAAAGFFGIIVLITLLRAEKSVANGALTVITLLAVGIAVAATIRGFGPDGGRSPSDEPRSFQPMTAAALPALSCIDDLAGETVLTACEKALFGSPESTAAALSYAGSQITRLTAFGDVASAEKSMTSELRAIRRAVERDRYGLMAYVLAARDHCTASGCAAFRSLTDSHQIMANMDEHMYDGLISRYAPLWNAPPPVAPVAALPSSMPTGRPTNADFPSASSTPPVSIMTPEPGTSATASAPRTPASSSVANAPLPSPRPTPATATPALAAAKKPPAPKPLRTAAPVQISPAPAAPAPAPAASND
jgi:hypothetical protein